MPKIKKRFSRKITNHLTNKPTDWNYSMGLGDMVAGPKVNYGLCVPPTDVNRNSYGHNSETKNAINMRFSPD